MSLPNVTINIERSGLGGVAITNDSIMGLCVTGVAVTDKLVLNTAYSIYSTDDLEAIGITVDGTNAFAYNQIKEFYDHAPAGAKLWIIVCADTVTIADMVDKAIIGCQTKKMQLAAQGEIRVIGCSWKPASGYTATALDGLDSLVVEAIGNADSLASDLVANITPAVFLLGATQTLTVASLKNLTTMTNPRVGVVISATEGTYHASVGLALGRLAAIPVQRKISRVKNGALNVLKGWLTNGETVEANESALNGIHDKGYIFFRKFPTSLTGICRAAAYSRRPCRSTRMYLTTCLLA